MRGMHMTQLSVGRKIVSKLTFTFTLFEKETSLGVQIDTLFLKFPQTETAESKPTI